MKVFMIRKKCHFILSLMKKRNISNELPSDNEQLKFSKISIIGENEETDTSDYGEDGKCRNEQSSSDFDSDYNVSDEYDDDKPRNSKGFQNLQNDDGIDEFQESSISSDIEENNEENCEKNKISDHEINMENIKTEDEKYTEKVMKILPKIAQYRKKPPNIIKNSSFKDLEVKSSGEDNYVAESLHQFFAKDIYYSIKKIEIEYTASHSLILPFYGFVSKENNREFRVYRKCHKNFEPITDETLYNAPNYKKLQWMKKISELVAYITSIGLVFNITNLNFIKR